MMRAAAIKPVLMEMRSTTQALSMTSTSCSRQMTADRPLVKLKRSVMYSSMRMDATPAAVKAELRRSRPTAGLTLSTLRRSSPVMPNCSIISSLTASRISVSMLRVLMMISVLSPAVTTEEAGSPVTSSPRA